MIAEYFMNYVMSILGIGWGVDAYVEFVPDKPDNCVTCFDIPAWELIESSALAVDNFGVQIQYRNKLFKSAQAQAMLVHKAIVGYSGDWQSVDTLSTIKVSMVTCLKMPLHLGMDPNQRHEVMAIYRVRAESVGDLFRL
jgi:hypothetical protein